MTTAMFMDRAFRIAGLMWSDSDDREGVDANAVRHMATELVGFEVMNYDLVRAQLLQGWMKKKTDMPTAWYSCSNLRSVGQAVAFQGSNGLQVPRLGVGP